MRAQLDRPRGADTDVRDQFRDATARLLETMPLTDLSVKAICDEAGLSRTTFYHYFSSKFAPVTSMVSDVMEGYFATMRPYHGRTHDGAPLVSGSIALKESLAGAAELWAEHRTLMRGVVDHWHEVPELGRLWAESIGRFTDAIAAEIDRERKEGAAPPGPSSRTLAASLVWASERCFYVASTGVDPDIQDLEQALESLHAIWAGAIYGQRLTL